MLYHAETAMDAKLDVDRIGPSQVFAKLLAYCLSNASASSGIWTAIRWASSLNVITETGWSGSGVARHLARNLTAPSRGVAGLGMMSRL